MSVSLVDGHIDGGMTDNEIIKALECHIKRHCWNDCPNATEERQSLNKPCSQMIAEDALNLINRQKAEIESNKAKIKISAECIARQDKEIESKNDLIHRQSDVISEQKEKLESIYSEAIKEFWGELKKRNTMDERIVSVASGDNLVKEMVGETDV